MKPGNESHLMERALPEDGAEILQLIESDAAQGGLSIVYTRRPNPVRSFALENAEASLVVMRGDNGSICFMEASIPRRVYLNGNAETLVYVCNVRKKEGTLYGVNFFKKAYDYELARRGGFAGFCSVLNANRGATDLFIQKKRKSLPPVEKLCDYSTFLINPAVMKKLASAGLDYSAVVPTADDLPEVLAFLKDEGRRYDLFPVVENMNTQFNGLELDDCVMIRDRAGVLQAFGALWDQRHYRQYVIKAYKGVYRLVRHASWLIERFGYIPLPRKGTTVPVLMLTLLLSRPGNLDYYRVLLRELAILADQKRCSTLVLGLSHNNACYPVWDQLKTMRIESTIYTYETEHNSTPRPDGQHEIHLECGLL